MTTTTMTTTTMTTTTMTTTTMTKHTQNSNVMVRGSGCDCNGTAAARRTVTVGLHNVGAVDEQHRFCADVQTIRGAALCVRASALTQAQAQAVHGTTPEGMLAHHAKSMPSTTLSMIWMPSLTSAWMDAERYGSMHTCCAGFASPLLRRSARATVRCDSDAQPSQARRIGRVPSSHDEVHNTVPCCIQSPLPQTHAA
jgi:hypothetical protein